MRLVLLLILAAGCAGRGRPSGLWEDGRSPFCQPSPQRIREAVQRGVQYLIDSQNPDGSWGKGMLTDGHLVLYSMVPGTHDACRVATTALCVMALREAGETEARRRGLAHLLSRGDARRDDGSLLYNTWAHIYALQALAGEIKVSPYPALKQAAAWHVDRLARYETYVGGWGYYDFQVGAQHPAGGATSFGTAAALVALREAHEAGVAVPEKLVRRAVRLVERTQLPNGAYLYGEDYKYIPRLPANQLRGSVGRIQPCNYALRIWGSQAVNDQQIVQGLAHLEREHAYIEMGRKRPYPHDSWYQTAPYYYFYDHYYASKLLRSLGEKDRQHYSRLIAGWILALQEADGSWWDFAMWDYHRPYGTAYAIMTLLACLEADTGSRPRQMAFWQGPEQCR